MANKPELAWNGKDVNAWAEMKEFYNKSMELVQRMRSEEFLCKAESMRGIKREDVLKEAREFEEAILPLKRVIEREAV